MTDDMGADLRAAIADSSDALTRQLRHESIERVAVAAIRDRLDAIAGREPWKPGDPDRPTSEEA
jgi:hypothetical protein